MKELFSLAGKRALVTGSSRGIGRAIALGFAEFGADVAVHYAVRQQEAQDVAAEAARFGVRAATVGGDLAQPGAARRVFNESMSALGRIDILVLNASVQLPEDFAKITAEQFERQVAVNLKSSLELLQLALPPMVERRWGRVLTVGSVQEFKPHPQMLVYAATKSAQASMARNLAKQVASCGITVNNLAPGVIDTERNRGRLADEAYRAKVLSLIPAGCIGEPADCVGTALLLCSAAGGYITGANFVVDGGMSL